MRHFHFLVLIAACLRLGGGAVSAADSAAIASGAFPAGWTVTPGREPDPRRSAAGRGPDLTAESPAVPAPAAFEVLFRLGERGVLKLALRDDAGGALEFDAAANALNQLALSARAEGKPLPAQSDFQSVRSRAAGKPPARFFYRWLFPKVGSLWDDDQRNEVGSSYEPLEPFAEKVFVARLVSGSRTRQIWMDGRLVAEAPGGSSPVRLSMEAAGTAEVVEASVRTPDPAAGFGCLDLRDFQRERGSQRPGAGRLAEEVLGERTVPVLWPAAGQHPLDLGLSLYRFRNVVKSGFGAPYAGANESWAGAFEVDPARAVFRVPNRNYAAVWLVASLSGKKDAVPCGAVRWFREKSGFPAGTDFEITEQAIRDGRVRRLDAKSEDGKDLFLVRVPVETHGFAGLSDLQDYPLNFEITKPVQPMRGYPDPIYYSSHPAGPPSAVRIHAVTLEESPFAVEVRPAQFSYVFQDPEPVVIQLRARSLSGRPAVVEAVLRTKSWDGTEESREQVRLELPAGGEASRDITLSPRLFGWHSLNVEARSGDHLETRCLSFLRLAPDQRSSGTRTNETRFGVWGSLHAHGTPFRYDDAAANDDYLRMLRKLGVRRVGYVPGATTMEQMHRFGFLPQGMRDPNFAVRLISRPSITEKDLDDLRRLNLEAAAPYAESWKTFNYYYGGEWQISREFKYGQDPRYTGQGARDLTDAESLQVARHMQVMETTGRALRGAYPGVRLILQWGAPKATLAYIMRGFPRELVDYYGMDAPMFELLPEVSGVLGSIHDLWTFRREVERLGWPQHDIYWREGPFFPTQPGALTEDQQADHMIRYFLAALSYGVSVFDGSVKPYDAASYYGAEHYGAGIFHRIPYANPKPAAAALATLTAKICGADPRPPVLTGVPTTYCAVFDRGGETVQALWRVRGKSRVEFSVDGTEALITDAMGNARKAEASKGRVAVEVGTAPIWVEGVRITGNFVHGVPEYEEKPSEAFSFLPAFAPEQWSWSTQADPEFASRHWATFRTAEPAMTAEFRAETERGGGSVQVTLPAGPPDRPLAVRYGKLTPVRPVPLPGHPEALGLWVRGNSGWGRVVFRLRDAKGELWTSTGARDEWNADDLLGQSFVCFEDWRYMRIPLPSHTAYDSFRQLGTSGWGSEGGDNVADYPMSLEAVFIEARNEVPVLGEMTLVPDRSVTLGPLRAEYASAAEVDPSGPEIPRFAPPPWNGPRENVIADLETHGADPRPVLKGFREPAQAADGRNMHVDFEALPGATYRLYVSRYPDGRGADLIAPRILPGDLVRGLRPGIEMHLFLVASLPEKKGDSKPSRPFRLVTEDKFREK